MSLQNCSECGSSVTASQLRCFDAVRCSSLCRRAFHTECVDIPPEAVQLLINLPTLLWQCDNCVDANGLHSKIDELTEKITTLETFCWDLHKQFRSEIASKQPEPVPRQAVAAAPFTLAREGDWNAAWNKKRNTGNAEPEFLVGVAPHCSELEVMQSKRYLHVGKFAVDTEPEAVVKYVAKKLNVTPKSLHAASWSGRMLSCQPWGLSTSSWASRSIIMAPFSTMSFGQCRSKWDTLLTRKDSMRTLVSGRGQPLMLMLIFGTPYARSHWEDIGLAWLKTKFKT